MSVIYWSLPEPTQLPMHLRSTHIHIQISIYTYHACQPTSLPSHIKHIALTPSPLVPSAPLSPPPPSPSPPSQPPFDDSNALPQTRYSRPSYTQTRTTRPEWVPPGSFGHSPVKARKGRSPKARQTPTRAAAATARRGPPSVWNFKDSD